MFSIIAQNFIDFSASLVRETHLPIHIYDTNHGITPARAGTTTSAPVTITPVKGSHPLAREPPVKSLSEIVVAGITPAHAGTTSLAWLTGSPGKDHPRSRGNHAPGIASAS